MTGDLDHASRRKPRDFRDMFTLEQWVKQYEQTIPQSSPFLWVVLFFWTPAVFLTLSNIIYPRFTDSSSLFNFCKATFPAVPFPQ